jgi:hypothetical protein
LNQGLLPHGDVDVHRVADALWKSWRTMQILAQRRDALKHD